MKIAFGLLIFSFLAGCSNTAPKVDGESAPRRGGGKSYSVTLSGSDKSEVSPGTFYLQPKDAEDVWTKEEKRCVKDIQNALALSGFMPAASAATADLVISVSLPKSSPATGLTFLAMMGAYRHSLELEAFAPKQQNKLIWTLKAHADHELDERRKIFPILALAMVGRFGSRTESETVSVDEFDPRFAQINAN